MNPRDGRVTLRSAYILQYGMEVWKLMRQAYPHKQMLKIVNANGSRRF